MPMISLASVPYARKQNVINTLQKHVLDDNIINRWIVHD